PGDRHPRRRAGGGRVADRRGHARSSRALPPPARQRGREGGAQQRDPRAHRSRRRGREALMVPPPGFFSPKELLLPPNLVSALRLPLALLFPFAARSKGQALAVLALAGLTDVLDGWLAREKRQVTPTGAVLDPIADKAFALSVVGTLIAQGKIPRWGIP